jgi:glyceraldehyde-3-phosphate dehydrogenase (NADP+)
MKMLLDGRWVDRERRIEVRDPFDDSVIDTVPLASPDDVERALEAAERGARRARRMPAHERARILDGAAREVTQDAERLATLIAREGSKTIREARKEVARAANTLALSAEEAKRLSGATVPFDSFPGGERRRGWFERMPVGIVAAVTPFNDPLNMVAHKLGPALAAGNATILKPATATPLSALALAEILLRHGAPGETLQVLTGNGEEIGGRLIGDPRVAMVSFTGGSEAGAAVARRAGVKKLAMELGSNSPVIVWRDADLEEAVASCVSGSFWAAGQNCIGVQRLLVHRDLYADFRDLFVERTERYLIGDKLREKTDMGPMIDEAEARRVESWVERAAGDGATVLTGGGRDGTLMQPTVLEGVPESAAIHCREVFGPTVNLYPVDDLGAAIDAANALPFGLHAAIFTRDVEVAFRAVRDLECGGVMVNDSTDYRLDSMPFGGVKGSGLGREGVAFAVREMTEPKVVCFHLPGLD